MKKHILTITIVFALFLSFFSVPAMAVSLSDVVTWMNNNYGEALDYDKNFGTQCVDLANYYLRDVFGIMDPIAAFPVSYAYQMFDYGAPDGFTKIPGNGSFQVGDLVIWNKGRFIDNKTGQLEIFGHVGVVYSVNGSAVTIFDQSPGGKATTHPLNYSNFIRGVFRPTLTSFIPTITMSVTPQALGPKIIVTTDGTGMYYKLWRDNEVVFEEPVNNATNMWDFSLWSLIPGTYKFEVQANSGGLHSEAKSYSFLVGNPSITLTVIPNSLGPKITVITDGTGMYYQLRRGSEVVSEGSVYSVGNLWDFSLWDLMPGLYTFEAQANNYELASEVKSFSFAIGEYTIIATAGSGGTVSGGGTYTYGASITLTAIPNANYHFDGWYDNDAKIQDIGAIYSFIIQSNRILEARFMPEVKVTGKVLSYAPSTPATVQLLQNNQVIHTALTETSPTTGQSTQPFTIHNVAPGDYTLVITKPGHTAFTVQKITVGGANLDLSQDPRPAVQMITLLCGDISGDGMINDGDLAVLWLAANYNKSADGPGVNKLCDLNGDGMINDGDLAILWLAVNYNKGAVMAP